MTLEAFFGDAGVGKTFSLFQLLATTLQDRPLEEGQRVLALTFMHGSRQRLEDQLRNDKAVCGRYSCLTVDRFAWELCRRWRGLLRQLGLTNLPEHDYEKTCDTAGMLLERPEVLAWVIGAYPVILLDEAQDLTPARLRMVKSLERTAWILAAADEFQCLHPALIPNPAVEWLGKTCQPQILDIIRRTERADLVQGARAVRLGQTVQTGKNLKIFAAPGKPPYKYAATCVANALTWNSSDDVAIITPARSRFVTSIIDLVSKEKLGSNKKVGPYPIAWEQSHSDLARQAMSNLVLPKDGDAMATLAIVAADQSHPAVAMCHTSLVRYQRLTGCKQLTSKIVAEQMEQSFSQYRRYSQQRDIRIKAMTVQQAKNREFAGVIVLWPYEINSAKDEQKRRLLYNAMTRATEWCTVIAQDNKMLNKCPFLGPDSSKERPLQPVRPS